MDALAPRSRRDDRQSRSSLTTCRLRTLLLDEMSTLDLITHQVSCIIPTISSSLGRVHPSESPEWLPEDNVEVIVTGGCSSSPDQFRVRTYEGSGELPMRQCNGQLSTEHKWHELICSTRNRLGLKRRQSYRLKHATTQNMNIRSTFLLFEDSVKKLSGAVAVISRIRIP